MTDLGFVVQWTWQGFLIRRNLSLWIWGPAPAFVDPQKRALNSTQISSLSLDPPNIMNASDLENAASFLFGENTAGVAVFVFLCALGFAALGWVAGFASRAFWFVATTFLALWLFLSFHIHLPLPTSVQAVILDAKQAVGL